MHKVLFLPGAGGSPSFWQRVAKLLPDEWTKEFFGWPGLGDQPHDPKIKCINDLVELVNAKISKPVDLVAQSIGGLIAARIALDKPTLVRRLVLVATSAGVDMKKFGANDWRADYQRLFPHAAKWIVHHSETADIPVERVITPTLLIWGDADPISPVSVGLHLEHRIPNSKLHVVPGGDHSVAFNKSETVANLIAQHLK